MASFSTKALKKITKKNLRVKKLKETLNNVAKYLKTDSHMYTHLLYGEMSVDSAPQDEIASATEGDEQHRQLAAPQEVRALKTNHPSEQEQVRRTSPRTQVVQHTLAYRQMVNHMCTLNPNHMATLNPISSPVSESGESAENRREVTMNAEEQKLRKFINRRRRY